MDVADSDDEFNMDPGGERETDEAALRAALHFSVGEICSAETSGKPMSGAAVSTLSEVSAYVVDRQTGQCTLGLMLPISVLVVLLLVRGDS